MDPAGGSHYIFVSSGQIAANASIAGTWQCGSSLTVNHIAGAVAPVNETVTYGTVTNISGETSKCWITSNLGANHQANTVNDATDASAGWYWQFNRKQGYTKVGNITPPWTITYIAEDLDWLTANDPCTSELGSGWRLPTSTEWMNVDATGNWTTWEGPWNSNLKLHAAGYLNTADGSRQNLGITGYYWSSNQFNTYSGWHLYFTSNDSWMYNMFPKALGFNVRCIKN